MKPILLIVTALLVAACNPGVKPPPVIPPGTVQKPADKKPDVTPGLTEAQTSDAEANRRAAEIAAQLEIARRNLSDTRGKLSEAKAQVDVLRNAKTQTKEEWDKLAAQITDTDSKLLMVERSHSKTMDELKIERELRSTVTLKLQQAILTAAEKQAEADMLRSQLDLQQRISNDQKQAAESAAAAANANSAAANTAKGQVGLYRNLLLLSAAGNALLLVACVLLARAALRL